MEPDRRGALLATAVAAVRELAADPATAMSDGDLVAGIAAVEQLGRLVDTVRCLLAGEVAVRSEGSDALCRRFGQTRPAALVAQLARITDAAASDRVRVGGVIAPRPAWPGDIDPDRIDPPTRRHLAAAMTDGQVGVESALTIDRCLTQAERVALPPAVAAAEQELTVSAASHPTGYLALEARVWRDWLDPDGIEPRADEIHDRRGLTLGRERGGLTPVRGQLEPAFAALIRAAFAESLSPDARPRFLPEQDCLDQPALGIRIGDGSSLAGTSDNAGSPATPPMTRATDPRTRDQKQHDILHGLITAGIRSTGTAPGEMRPVTTVLATITVDELQNGAAASVPGTGRFDQVEETIPAHLITQAVCDAGLRIVTTDGLGGLLDEGRRYRLFTDRQRRVIALRDGGCAVPGCTAPASWCEVHHILYWLADNGATDIDNGVLLCPAHHRDVHRGLFTIRMIDRTPHLIPAPWVEPTRTPVPMGHPLGRPRDSAGMPRRAGRGVTRSSPPRTASRGTAAGP